MFPSPLRRIGCGVTRGYSLPRPSPTWSWEQSRGIGIEEPFARGHRYRSEAEKGFRRGLPDPRLTRRWFPRYTPAWKSSRIPSLRFGHWGDARVCTVLRRTGIERNPGGTAFHSDVCRFALWCRFWVLGHRKKRRWCVRGPIRHKKHNQTSGGDGFFARFHGSYAMDLT